VPYRGRVSQRWCNRSRPRRSLTVPWPVTPARIPGASRCADNGGCANRRRSPVVYLCFIGFFARYVSCFLSTPCRVCAWHDGSAAVMSGLHCQLPANPSATALVTMSLAADSTGPHRMALVR